MKPVIGLEVHVELKTKSKMFCSCSAEYFGKEPNTHTCPVCLGLPGALPVPNEKAIEWCVKIGLALNCKVNLFSKFDRKNYFYPDLPKGYQISQYDLPFSQDGYVILNRAKRGEGSSQRSNSEDSSAKPQNDNTKRIGIRRVHMEEDTGKLIHEQGSSLIDFNRSGVPLVEIVTEPDFESEDEVVEYLKKLQQIVRYLEVSDADMEKGEMRLEPNISLQSSEHRGQLPNYKVEVKNINSFRFVDKAIKFEIKRQEEILNSGETPKQETRGWDEKSGTTKSQRSKEEAQDYRYFPEPDIPPISFTTEQIEEFKSQMPELPDDKFNRFKQEYELNDYDAEILTRERLTANYFVEAVKVGFEHKVSAKQIANYLINKKVNTEEVLPSQLVQLVLSSTQTAQIDDTQLNEFIEKALIDNNKAVEDYKSGKEQALNVLLGAVMREAKTKLDTNTIKEKILERLKSR